LRGENDHVHLVFSTCRLRFTNGVATIHAKLASGWLAGVLAFWLNVPSVDVREMFFLKSIQMVEGSGVPWFAGVLQSLCPPS
jgi:hypothetical protein